MASAGNTIDHVTLERLVEAGAVRGADVVGHPGGWGVVVRYGMTERTLAARRGAVRSFRRFETLVSYLKAIGIYEYRVNAADFDPQSLKGSRPDASERMKRAFEAEKYAVWVQDKVESSLSDPAPNVSHAQVMDDVQALIESKRRQHAGRGKQAAS